MNIYDVAIIGAGPAGMLAAITAGRNGKRVALIEKNPQPGRKLLATGNGRCNLTNASISVDRYHGATPEFIEAVLSQFDQPATMSFFEDLGIIFREEDNGRIFPRTNQASSVVEILKLALSESGVDTLTDTQVVGVEKPKEWKISFQNGKSLKSHSLIIATGGRAAFYLGSTGDGLHWAQKFGHKYTPIHASLVPIETVETWPKEVQGVRVTAAISATSGEKILRESAGDLLFTNYGVSGTAILELSGRIAPILHTSKVSLHINLFPNMTESELFQTVSRIFRHIHNRTITDSLIGIIPDKLIPVLVKAANLDLRRTVGDISKTQILELVRALRGLTLTVAKVRP
ncbi:MAG TPA: aminoacetone oxidase family FAD-binding enzyme, partial [Armatimonadota bacterium]